MNRAIIYIHGKGGSYLEGEQYKQNCVGFEIVGVDYDEYRPWLVEQQIKLVYDKLAKKYAEISLIANSIGAYLGMHILQGHEIKRALFISPILDMEKLILDMLQWANVTEQELCRKDEIVTDFDETLSWEYLSFVRQHPIIWDIPTAILFGAKDNLTSSQTVEDFVASHQAKLTVMENGEHWFQTTEQLVF